MLNITIGSKVRYTAEVARKNFLGGLTYVVTAVGKRTVTLVHEDALRTRSRGTVCLLSEVESV